MKHLKNIPISSKVEFKGNVHTVVAIHGKYNLLGKKALTIEDREGNQKVIGLRSLSNLPLTPTALDSFGWKKIQGNSYQKLFLTLVKSEESCKIYNEDGSFILEVRMVNELHSFNNLFFKI